MKKLTSIFVGVISFSIAFVLALAIEDILINILIPDYCLYHSAEYLGGKEVPWWITVFFPLDEMRHPSGMVVFSSTLVFGTIGIYFAIRNIIKYFRK